MNAGRKIIGLGASLDERLEQQSDQGEQVVAFDDESDGDDDDHDAYAWEEELSSPTWIQRIKPRLIPALLILAALGWTALFAWGQEPALSSLSRGFDAVTAARLSELIMLWSIPMALIAILWLLAMRSSTREAGRFGDAAQLLAAESQALETRLQTVNNELSLARSFLATQVQELDGMGRRAVDKLQGHARQLADIIAESHDRMERIGEISGSAVQNMEQLRSHMPVLATSAKDVTNQIGNAGRTANAQLKEMIEGFARLNEFGQASTRHADDMRLKMGETIGTLDTQMSGMLTRVETGSSQILTVQDQASAQMSERQQTVLAALESQVSEIKGTSKSLFAWIEGEQARVIETARQQQEELLIRQESQQRALADGMTGLISDLGSATEHTGAALSTMMARHRGEGQSLGEQLAAQTRDHEAAWKRVTEALGAEQERLSATLAHATEQAANSFATLSAEMAALRASGDETQASFAAHGQSIQAVVAQYQDGLTASQRSIHEMTDGSVRLLELIQAASVHAEEKLPVAFVAAEERLQQIRNGLDAVDHALASGSMAADQWQQVVVDARQAIFDQRGEIMALTAQVDEGLAKRKALLTDIRSVMASTADDGERLADLSETRIMPALQSIRAATAEAGADVAAGIEAAIEQAVARIGPDQLRHVDALFEEQGKALLARMDDAASKALASANDSATMLRDQLRRIDELAGNLEQRVAQARSRAEEQVDNDFARRVALITEALNSTAIDVTKLLSSEVTDTAWASYLRGDRGIFTRRAVRLIEAGEAREIAQHYDADPEFRDNVNRYIHDFEAMLRMLLSTRDGNALGVTLLSSDIGKLYVALAQAIERLRD